MDKHTVLSVDIYSFVVFRKKEVRIERFRPGIVGLIWQETDCLSAARIAQ